MKTEADVLVATPSACFCVLDGSISLESRQLWEEGQVEEFFRMVTDGEMIACLLHSRGVFRLRFRVADRIDGAGAAGASANTDSHDLHLATGRLAVRDSCHGEPLLNVFSVPPGWYKVIEHWYPSQESEHWGLEQEQQYPAGDGPDGVFTLVRQPEGRLLLEPPPGPRAANRCPVVRCD